MSLSLQPLAPADRPEQAIAAAAPFSPYLAKLARCHPATLDDIHHDGVRAAFDTALEPLRTSAAPVPDVAHALRLAKQKAHLVIAAADLSRAWNLGEVTAAMSDLADLCTQRALEAAWMRAVEAGHVGTAPFAESGLFALAMGKMGAHELNYSSDVDLIILFDPERLTTGARKAGEIASLIAGEAVRTLHESSEDGYAFRVDLRLRPDPGSTAIAVSSAYALGYYESVGQNWERMAYIKARHCAGDDQAAFDFLQQMTPFVWRRALDYWTIEDIRAIAAQIHAGGKHHELDDRAFDVKLGRGGIRAIEFLVQTQQLILGGRMPSLRAPTSIAALAALADAGILDPGQAAQLAAEYDFLRNLEHRIQMIDDEQTHLLPDHPEQRRKIYRLCGMDADAFDQRILRTRRTVDDAYSHLFARDETTSGGGNLVFTGVDDDPGTLTHLAQLGFSSPSTVIKTIRRWHRGGVPATGSVRGREILTRLTPILLGAMSETGAPDAAFERFNEFIANLRAGVQAFSLLLARDDLTRDLIATMSYAPRLARDLATHPVLLDAMLDPRFSHPLAADSPRLADAQRLTAGADFENACNAVRRFHREENLRIGYQFLKGTANIADVSHAHADLAVACIGALASAAEAETERLYGPWNARWIVGGLGRLGGGEMTALSDLDIMLIYQAESGGSENHAARFAQRLISALSAPTEEGMLYEVDMRLRPSGRAGPVAVKVSAFEKYYAAKAWTWEYMALTRLRPIAGDAGLSLRIEALIRDLLANAAHADLKKDVQDMRCRIARERPPHSRWDLKLAAGGLFDIEFIVQMEMLAAAPEHPELIVANTSEAIAALVRAGRLDAAEGRLLAEAHTLQLCLLHCLCIAFSGHFRPSEAPERLRHWLAERTGTTDFDAVQQNLFACQDAVAAVRRKKIGPLPTESSLPDV